RGLNSYRTARLEPTDLYINLELTHGCNLRCRTCHVSAGDVEPVSLDRDRLPRVLSSVLSMGRTHRLGFTMTGGEPTLVPFLPEVVAAVRREPAVRVVSVVTNGTLLDESLMLRLGDAGLDWVAVSLDGGTAGTNDCIRGEGCFKAAVEALVTALERTNLYVSSSLTVTRLNLTEVETYVRTVYELGACQAHVNPFIPVGRGSRNEDWLAITPSEQVQLMEKLRELELEYLPDGFIVSFGEPFYGLTDPVEPFGEAKYIEGKPACGIGVKAVTVSPVGDVLPCSYMRDMVVGNVLDQTLADIWSGQAMSRLRDDSLLKGRCGSCDLRRYCRGCRARARLLSGDLHGEDPWCPRVLSAQRRVG
ncbi:MAG TPA: hypothetical protein DEQ28_08700, partial [Clostridiales bacterium]|nr:hypothetical protein [Clostridiales bacterium]